MNKVIEVQNPNRVMATAAAVDTPSRLTPRHFPVNRKNHKIFLFC